MIRFASIAAVALAACAVAGPTGLTAKSAWYPDIEIECHGEPELSVAACVAWAERLLATAPDGATRIVLEYRTGNTRCSADYFAANGRLLMTAAALCPTA